MENVVKNVWEVSVSEKENEKVFLDITVVADDVGGAIQMFNNWIAWQKKQGDDDFDTKEAQADFWDGMYISGLQEQSPISYWDL